MHAENPLNEYKLEQVLREEEKEEVGCKASLNESFIIMKLIWHGYLVSNLDIYAHETPTETGLSLQPVLTQEPRKFMR